MVPGFQGSSVTLREGDQGAHFGDRSKVAIVVQQAASILQGDLRNDAVGSAANAQATATAVEKDARGFDVTGREIRGDEERLAGEIFGKSAPLLFVARALQDFLHDDGREGHFVRTVARQKMVEVANCSRVSAGEKVDEYRGVDENHVPLRSAL